MRRTAALVAPLISIACGAEDEDRDRAPPAVTARWQTVHQDLDGALLRVWGSSRNDVYAVGSDPLERGSLALHFDGVRWRRLETGSTGDLWWLHRVGDDDVRMVGENGLVLRYRPSTGAFEKLSVPDEQVTLFGVCGTGDDVWYVGGAASLSRGVVWREQNGGPIAAVTAPGVPLGRGAIYKAHNFDDGRVWLVGQDGRASLWNGSAFEDHDISTRGTLFTVHGVDADRVFAVGDAGAGLIYAWSGSAWIEESPAESGPISAIWAVDRERAFAAAFNGSFFERREGAWAPLEVAEARPTLSDLHSMYVDETGGIWAVGGQLASDPPRDGVMVHYGEPIAVGL